MTAAIYALNILTGVSAIHDTLKCRSLQSERVILSTGGLVYFKSGVMRRLLTVRASILSRLCSKNAVRCDK